MNEYNQLLQSIREFGQRYIEQARQVVAEPRDFFRSQREVHGFLEPTFFACMNIILPKLLFSLMVAPLTFGLSLFLVIPAVFYAACLLMIVVGLLQGLLHLAGAKTRFELTYRCVAYASITYYLWLIPIPFLNLLLFTAAFCGLLFYAFQEVYRLDAQKALAVVSPAGLLILVMGTLVTLAGLWVIIRGLLTLIRILTL